MQRSFQTAFVPAINFSVMEAENLREPKHKNLPNTTLATKHKKPR